MMLSESFFSHDVIKVFSGDFLSVLGSSFQHFSQFVIAHGFSQLFGDFPQIRKVDSVTAVFVE